LFKSQKDKKKQNYIHSDPNILVENPTIKETRLSVEFLLDRLADGWSEDSYFSMKPIRVVQICIEDDICSAAPVLFEFENRG
jgi:Protein of unknown function (DUF433)